jgi:hypothetical protein
VVIIIRVVAIGLGVEESLLGGGGGGGAAITVGDSKVLEVLWSIQILMEW